MPRSIGKWYTTIESACEGVKTVNDRRKRVERIKRIIILVAAVSVSVLFASYFIEGITQIENTVLMPMNENTPNEFNKRINGGNTNGIFSGFKI